MSKVRTRGYDKLSRKLAKLPDAMTAELVKQLGVAGDAILAEARARVPVATGRLKNALSKRVAKKGLKVKVGVQGAPAKRKAPHFFFVEYGTVKTRAQPFLGPAAKAVIQKTRPKLRAALKTTAERVAGK